MLWGVERQHLWDAGSQILVSVCSDQSPALSLAWGCSGTQELHGRALSISFYLPDIAQSVYLRKFYPAQEDSQIPVLPFWMT